MLAALLIDGTRWIIVFPALVLFLAAWIGQAVNAQRRALELGAAPGGEMQVVLVLPIVAALVSAFWLIGGDGGSAAATLREYVAAWRAGQPEAAAALFVERVDADTLAATWQLHERELTERVDAAAATFGPTSGINPARPFNSLRFLEHPAASDADEVTVGIDIVRRQRVETMLLGIIPTATQQTVVVDELGLVRLRAVPADPPAWLPGLRPLARVWRIESLEIAVD
ncbi:MAG: hypothetical protein M3N29_02245 [Chloroflexota bacterium]|nr:hypothetical protein [Chloroflexota bacterium]